MTEDEVHAMVVGLAPVVRDYVARALAQGAVPPAIVGALERELANAIKEITALREQVTKNANNVVALREQLEVTNKALAVTDKVNDHLEHAVEHVLNAFKAHEQAFAEATRRIAAIEARVVMPPTGQVN